MSEDILEKISNLIYNRNKFFFPKICNLKICLHHFFYNNNYYDLYNNNFYDLHHYFLYYYLYDNIFQFQIYDETHIGINKKYRIFEGAVNVTMNDFEENKLEPVRLFNAQTNIKKIYETLNYLTNLKRVNYKLEKADFLRKMKKIKTEYIKIEGNDEYKEKVESNACLNLIMLLKKNNDKLFFYTQLNYPVLIFCNAGIFAHPTFKSKKIIQEIINKILLHELSQNPYINIPNIII